MSENSKGPERLTMWQTVLQSQLIHPDWNAQDHLDYLHQEGYDWTRLVMSGLSPSGLVSEWLKINPSLPIYQNELKRLEGRK